MELIENLSADNIALIWLLAGAVFFTLEVAAVPGIGFLFAGFAAITVGGLINFSILDSTSILVQMASFFGLIFIWAAILWYPLTNFRKRSMQHNYQNIIGDTAIVACDVIDKKKTGKVMWSGTIVKAKLDESDLKKSVGKDDEVIIKEIKGNVLIVKSQ